MTNYWPSGLDLSDTSSPLEILQSARDEWTEQSKGLLTLVIQEAKSTCNNHMLIVHAKHVPSNRTVTLFSVVHRPDAPYPATIQPRGDELPNVFKKSYYKPGFANIAAGMALSQSREVTNEWVCDTPSEFRPKLERVFNLGALKSEVLSLVSQDASAAEIDGETEEKDETSDGERDDVAQ